MCHAPNVVLRAHASALVATLAATGWVAPVGAQQQPDSPSQQSIYSRLEADSLSVGHADSGGLQNPFAVASSDVLASVRPHKYGTRELVGLLDRAARAVARSAPGSRLAVGDLSSEQGGQLSPHESHQSGRDADVGFYMLDEVGQPVPQAIFQRVHQDGTARRGDRNFRFDDSRNWLLLVAFVDDPMAETQYVILAPHIRERLLAHARNIGADQQQIRRVEVVTARMRGSDGHDDHFHVRIYCSVGDRPQCLDRPPLHPWYNGTPSPDAVAAARVADLLRASALRRRQRQARDAENELAHGQARHRISQKARARELRRERGRQAHAERRRAARLSRGERRALRELQRMEVEANELAAQAEAEEHGRAAGLVVEQRQWRKAEARRARRLRAAQARFEADERKRARSQARQAARLARKAEAQQQADRRRAQALMRRGEQLRLRRAQAEKHRLPHL